MNKELIIPSESIKNKIHKLDEENIKNKIYTIRGLKVMFDKDLADLYEV